jgi:hypothetical protein
MRNALNYQSIKNQTKTVLALTGLESEEFELLLETFTQVYEQKYFRLTLDGKVRERKTIVKERFNGQLPLYEDKLLFILYQIKQNPLQESMAVTFGMKQPHVSKWLKLLRPLLQETLKREYSLPERNPKRLWIKIKGKDLVIIDGVERPIQRNKDKDIQTQDYSGKKSDI